MKRFEPLDISGDAGIRVFGNSASDIFVNAALGMYSIMTSLPDVKQERTIDVALESDSIEDLLVSWLNELVFQFDTYGFIGSSVAIRELSDIKLSASVAGEDFDPGRHQGKLLIKAATYHKLKIEEKDGLWQADIIFDI